MSARWLPYNSLVRPKSGGTLRTAIRMWKRCRSRYCENSEAEAANAKMVVGARVEPSHNAKRTVLTCRQGAKVDGVASALVAAAEG